MQFSTGAHCVYNLKAHLIFVVAYRRKAISSRILQRLMEIFSDVSQREQSELLECSGEREHVHRLILHPPKLCLSELIRKLKAISSLKIRREFNSEIRHLLWGKRFWTKSYCVISVGDGATTEIIEQYIRNQRPN
ncbi:MAG TPA: IS200/IS605 family transposase [Candidatus Aphodousia faecigallinarum]|uniref:IS200/IS605 family transposase n=1 Tax=Candidatus Aphodousia faecigallinarum TaxID=2840677 RepID=A0A9D1LDW4_9BURK|nr:IS200/IS605 family transposase [Candidatus Aphodousia faecigallinarum]